MGKFERNRYVCQTGLSRNIRITLHTLVYMLFSGYKSNILGVMLPNWVIGTSILHRTMCQEVVKYITPMETENIVV